MKKLFVLLCAAAILAIGLTGSSFAGPAGIKIGKGDLKIGAILQAGFDYSLAEDSLAVNGQFTFNRARFLLWGTIVPDKVQYFVQTEAKGGAGALDYKMILLGFIPKTSITVGRFLPNFSLYMPAPTSKLDMINYPVFITGGAAAGMTVPGYAMWRQCGIQTATKMDPVDFNVGLFNGPTNNMSDANDAKSVLLRAGFTPKTEFAKITVGGYGWLDNLLMAEDEDLAKNRFGFFGTLKKAELTVKGELVMGSDEQQVGDDVKSQGFYAHAGYKVSPQIEVLGRFDSFDPNTDVEDNAWTWITLGANYCLDSYNAMIYLNYIMRLEENDWGTGETIKNDEIRLQFQVAP